MKIFNMNAAKIIHGVAFLAALIAILITAMPHKIKMYPSAAAQKTSGDLAGISQVEYAFKLHNKVKIKPTGSKAAVPDLSYASMYSGGTASVHSMYFPTGDASGNIWLDTACKKDHEANEKLRTKLFRHGFASWRMGMLIFSVVAAFGSAILFYFDPEKYSMGLSVLVVLIGLGVATTGALALDDGLDATRCFWESYRNQTNWETVANSVGGDKPEKSFKMLKQMFRAEYAFVLIYGILWIFSGVVGGRD